MGLSLSVLRSSWIELFGNMFGIAQDVEVVLVKSLSFNEKELKRTLRSLSFKKRTSESMPSPAPSPTPKEMAKKPVLEQSFSFKNWETECAEPQIPAASRTNGLEMGRQEIPSPGRSTGQVAVLPPLPASSDFEFSSPRPKSELDAAAVKLQKVYKSYRTRRNLADCAVVVEELWWKALDFASLKRSSISFFEHEKPETAVSKWARAMTRVAKVGKGLSKDEKAQKLALRHWLEAIDPRHRYGHNLHIYYDLWFESESTQPFFYWLDIGDGKDVNLEKCPRSKLQRQIIEYLGVKEREAYEVFVEEGKLVYKQSQELVDTVEGSKWIFVLSTSRNLYVGQKKKGRFQHSSFLAGGATSAAGRLVAQQGVLKAIWPYSGHYLPTQENFKEFISFLADHDVDLADVKKCSVDDDEFPSSRMDDQETAVVVAAAEDAAAIAVEAPKQPFELAKRLSRKWSTGAGPRIGCVRDYPVDLQIRALEHVNLSPRVVPSPAASRCPIPSPRPSPRVRLSPGLQYMGFPSPKVAPPMAFPSPRLAPAMRFSSPMVSLTLPKPKQR